MNRLDLHILSADPTFRFERVTHEGELSAPLQKLENKLGDALALANDQELKGNAKERAAAATVIDLLYKAFRAIDDTRLIDPSRSPRYVGYHVQPQTLLRDLPSGMTFTIDGSGVAVYRKGIHAIGKPDVFLCQTDSKGRFEKGFEEVKFSGALAVTMTGDMIVLDTLPIGATFKREATTTRTYTKGKRSANLKGWLCSDVNDKKFVIGFSGEELVYVPRKAIA